MIRRVVVRCGAICGAVVTSDVAWLFAMVHGVVLVLCVANMSPPNREFADSLDRVYANGGWSSATVYAGRPFHLAYESLPLQLLTLADMPAELLAAVVGVGLGELMPLPSDHYGVSYLVLGLNTLFASMQWLIIGALFARGLRSEGRGDRWVTAFRNRRRIVFGMLIIIVLVGAPLLQWRSYQLGFRHPGISFGPR